MLQGIVHFRKGAAVCLIPFRNLLLTTKLIEAEFHPAPDQRGFSSKPSLDSHAAPAQPPNRYGSGMFCKLGPAKKRRTSDSTKHLSSTYAVGCNGEEEDLTFLIHSIPARSFCSDSKK
jgi:hypothetical protein